MRLLLLNQFFPPDPAPTGRLLADVARHLAECGHEVTVICGRTGYRPGEAVERPPVRVLDVPGLPFSRSGAARASSYLTFLTGALIRGLSAGRPEVVVTLTTPPLLSLVGTAIKRLRRSRHFIWEMDVYPDVAVALGVLKPGSRVTRALGALADYARRQADGLIALGPCMRDRLVAHDIPSERVRVAENWADGGCIQPRPWPPEGTLRVLYSGHFGLAHEFDTVCAVMARLQSDARFEFVFAGDGPRRAMVEDFCRAEGISNVRFLPYQETARLSEHFGACHVGLVTQETTTLGTVVPSKIYSLMAAARPVIYVGPREATPARTLERFRCGWQVDPGDSGALVSLLELLAADLALVREAGARGHQAILEHYDLPAGVSRIAEILGLSERMELRAEARSSTLSPLHQPGSPLESTKASGWCSGSGDGPAGAVGC